MSKKIDIFGKSLNTPISVVSLSASQPEPFGGIPSGVFAVFAVTILALSLGSGIDLSSLFGDDDPEPYNSDLTESQSTYLGSILSDRSRSSPTLSTYDTCGFLEMDLKEHLKEEMRVNLGTGSYYYGGWGMDDMVMQGEPEMAMDEDGGMDNSAPSTGSSDKSSSGPEQGVDYSGTNNQEQGVDEADFVKTDGS
ncbi:uncharacterized protein METZ01_LOCUS437837, partial [marine metagenome]